MSERSAWPVFISETQLMDNSDQVSVGEDLARRVLFHPLGEWNADMFPEEAVVELDWPKKPNSKGLYVVQAGDCFAAFHTPEAPPRGRNRGVLVDAWYWYTPVPVTQGKITRIQVLSLEFAPDEEGTQVSRPVPGSARLRDVDRSPDSWKTRRVEDPADHGVLVHVDCSGSE